MAHGTFGNLHRLTRQERLIKNGLKEGKMT
jgi:hypothetical protein